MIFSPTLETFPEISFPFSYEDGPNINLVEKIIRYTQIPRSSQDNLLEVLRRLYESVFRGKEAFLVEVDSVVINIDGDVAIEVKDKSTPGIRVYFDDAAYKSSRRHAQMWEMRDESGMAAEEVQAQKNEIVYIKLQDENVNGNHGGELSLSGTAVTPKTHIGCLGMLFLFCFY